MVSEGDYPVRLEGKRNDTKPWWKKGDKIEYFCIAGGKDSIFKAEKIEFLGFKFNQDAKLTSQILSQL